jgi:hypothetical protein
MQKSNLQATSAPSSSSQIINSDSMSKPYSELFDCGGFCGDCALKAHGIRAPDRAPPAKLSSQLGTESCVVIGNEHHEA